LLIARSSCGTSDGKATAGARSQQVRQPAAEHLPKRHSRRAQRAVEVEEDGGEGPAIQASSVLVGIDDVGAGHADADGP